MSYACELWGSNGSEGDVCLLGFHAVWTSTLKMETVCSSITLVSTYKPKQSHNPEDKHHHEMTISKWSIIQDHLWAFKLRTHIKWEALLWQFGSWISYALPLIDKIFQCNVTTKIIHIKPMNRWVSYRIGLAVLVVALLWRVWASLVSPGLELDVVQPPPFAKAFPLPVSVWWRWLELLRVLLQDDWEVG